METTGMGIGIDYFQQLAIKAVLNAIPRFTKENFSTRRDKIALLFELKRQ